MKILIISNGDVPDSQRLKNYAAKVDYIIAADGGAKYLSGNSIIPNCVIGDFDSIDPSLLQSYESQGVDCTRYPEAKDYSDHELAVDVALRKGATEIIFAGILGGRLEYTLTNVLFCTQPRFKGISITILDGIDVTVKILQPRQKYSIKGKEKSTFSLVPLTPVVSGVIVTGSVWSLENAALNLGNALTISNQFISDEIALSFESGSLLISYCES